MTKEYTPKMLQEFWVQNTGKYRINAVSSYLNTHTGHKSEVYNPEYVKFLENVVINCDCAIDEVIDVAAKKVREYETNGI